MDISQEHRRKKKDNIVETRRIRIIILWILIYLLTSLLFSQQQQVFKEYKLYESFELSDSLRITEIQKKWDVLSLDSHNLNIVGSKTISLTTSSNETFGLYQSLFLRLDGELAPNVNILAQLSDSQAKITPEGDSKELSSLDEVYLKIYGKEYEFALGDMDFAISQTQFMNFNPKFEGLKFSYFDRQKVSGAIALSNGKTTSISFAGVEGKQGPYYLKPNGVYEKVNILSGTETIWLNGKQMERGADYRIDYQEGYIDFNIKHFISRNSFIQASFQYSDEFYRKNTFLEATELMITERIKIKSALIYQKDDKDNPISEVLTKEEQEMLKNSRDQVYVSGVNEVEKGLGNYKKNELFENNELITIYIFAPGDPEANYLVRFSFMGSGHGSYKQITTSRFDYIGRGQGDFEPLREIKAPELKANYDFSLQYQGDFFSLLTESLFTEYDQNLFSPENKDNFSRIHHLQLDLHPDWDNIQPELKTWYRYRTKNLYTFANIKSPEENYLFNTLDTNDQTEANEIYVNFTTTFYQIFTQESTFKQSNFTNATENYLILNQEIPQTSFSPDLKYQYSLAKNNSLQKTEITLHEPAAEYKYHSLTLNANARLYKNIIHIEPSYISMQNNNASLLHEQSTSSPLGEKIHNLYYQISYVDLFSSGFNTSYSTENNYSLQENWRPESKSVTWTMESYTTTQNHNFTTLYSHRIIQSWNQQEKEQKFDIAEIKSTNSFFEQGIQFYGSYFLKNTEFFPQSKELYYVGKGAGSYDSTGVWVGDGEYEWETAIIGSPTKSIELLTNLHISLYPGQLLYPRDLTSSNLENDVFPNFWHNMNLETEISISEQTENKEKWKVYLLQPSALMNTQSIYAHQEFRHTLWYNLQKNKWLSHYSFLSDQTKDRRYDYSQSYLRQEHELSLRLLRMLNTDWEAIYHFSNEQDSKYRYEAKTNGYEIRIKSYMYHFFVWETKLGYDLEIVNSLSQKQIIDRIILNEELMYFWGYNYRLNGNFRITQNIVQNPLDSYLPPDKQEGYNLTWLLGMNYKINTVFSLNTDYSGYQYPKQTPFHQLTMEIRAEF